MSERLRIIVLAAFGRIPYAGMAWQAMHYVEGLRRLGHDVHYVEDTWDWPFNPEKNEVTNDNRYTIAYIARVMAWCGMQDRWAYRAVEEDGRVYGLSESQLARVFAEADVLINVTASTELHEEQLKVPIRVYLQTDPGAREIKIAKGEQVTLDFVHAHTHYFTFAENLGASDCRLPSGPFHYHATRQPIVLDWFSPQGTASRNGHDSLPLRFTTVANWQQSGSDVEWEGEVYTWSKHTEFLKLISLPGRVREALELALACDDPDAKRLLRSNGWQIVNALSLSADILPYRDYIVASDGEFTVAKDQNVRLRTGWFSDRSASYLAASKPVITQDTAFGRALPTGEGLFAFNTTEEIVDAFADVRSDYKRHSRAARAIAEEYFRAETVLAKLIADLDV